MAAGDFLQLLETLNVVLQILAPRAGPGRGNRVRSLHKASHHRMGLHVVVVGLDGMNDVFLLLVLSGKFHAQLHMGAFHLVVHGLAQIVKQARPLGGLRVRAQLYGHHTGDVADLDGVLQNVLAVAGAVMKPAQHLHKLRMEIAHAGFKHGALALGLNHGVHFPAGLFHHLLNVSGVNAPVGNKLFQRQPGNLPADRLKAGNGNGLRRVVDNQVHAGQGFDGADIAALAADDAALHLVVGKRHHADGHFRHGVRRAALDGLRHHLAGAGIALLFHAGFHFFDFHGGFVRYLALHLLDEIVLGLLGGKAGDTLQHLRLAALDGFDFLSLPVHLLVLLGQGIFLFLNGLGFTVEVLFLLLQAVFLPLQLGPAFLYFLLMFAAVFQDLFLCFQQGFFLLGFCTFYRLVDDAPSLFFGA
ncbi:hypothetical protein SDC9_60669 [bioreactor metagenome]|uniref:NAD-specific glutamate dehydrogenase n=1 Tax=bioreactor metagenome TaxID=1076179 RepID=A0A644XEH4_9ZZZZ